MFTRSNLPLTTAPVPLYPWRQLYLGWPLVLLRVLG